ncbi:hypothetical protein [Microbulbifer sp. 2205BS26-8]|uniref:hypothetical protein n=1 Tax=Microbulbifer sp. 2205BS26-8 TaxID=3064386 RepID=UPI0027402A26|nr:hypothetical protein [Microbulbifer sp. 2205BS26-8]MDP5211267.1 hypothetical protein [Microbulbifer sp. 2205BS26-8]
MNDSFRSALTVDSNAHCFHLPIHERQQHSYDCAPLFCTATAWAEKTGCFVKKIVKESADILERAYSETKVLTVICMAQLVLARFFLQSCY